MVTVGNAKLYHWNWLRLKPKCSHTHSKVNIQSDKYV